MALKKQISKTEFDGLPQHFKSEYKASGENFVLDIEGDDGIDWKRKREIEAEHRQNAEKRLKEIQDERDNLLRGAIPKNDVEALETSWRGKIEEVEKNYKTKLQEKDAQLQAATITATAKEIAALFLAPRIVIPMISSRLKAEFVDGVPVMRVLDKNGQLSAMTLDDLKKEYKTDPELAEVLVGSKGSGGGGGRSGDGGAGGKKELKNMNDAERIEWARRDPSGFRAAVDAQKLKT